MKKNVKSRLVIAFLLFFILLFGTGFVLAQSELEITYPEIPEAKTPTSTQTVFSDYVKYIFNFSIIIACLVAFASLIIGGFCYLTSAGDSVKHKNCRDKIFAALLGLIILLSAYLLLNTINPQLVILSLSDMEDMGPIPVIPAPPPPSVMLPTLHATEIPLGRLIDGIGEEQTGGSNTSPLYTYEGVLSKERMERIIELSEEIWDTSKKIFDISEDIEESAQRIKDLTDQCNCGNCGPIGCYSCSSCGYCSCAGDPCPNRAAIQAEQANIIDLANQLPPLKEKLELLRDDPATEYDFTGERQKLINAVNELVKAERIIRECPFYRSPSGRMNILLNYYAYNIDNERLTDPINKRVEEVISAYPWRPTVSGDLDPTTFYCREKYLNYSSIDIEISESDIALLEDLEVICEGTDNEIPVGYVIENVKDIGNRLIAEMEKVINEIPIITNEITKEITNAQTMSVLPDQCVCHPKCICNCVPCCCCSDTCCCHCHATPCRQNFNYFPDTPCPFTQIQNTLILIQENHAVITAAYNNITVYDDEIHNLIEGDEVHNPALTGSERIPTWAYYIVANDHQLHPVGEEEGYNFPPYELITLRERLGLEGCITSKAGYTFSEPANCEDIEWILQEAKLISKTDLEKKLDDCSNSSELYVVKGQIPLCTTGKFYLSDTDVCKGKFYCCDKINHLCCESY